VKAIHSPHTGIVDWALVTEYYAKDFKNAGGKIFTDFEVKKFGQSSSDADYPVTLVGTNKQKISSKYILTCAGLQADKVAALTGNTNPPKIVPFRGEYLLLDPSKAHMVKGNIYPVPDPRFPFLGVHFTVSIQKTFRRNFWLILRLFAAPDGWSNLARPECSSRLQTGRLQVDGHQSSRTF
jgi:2-hydroxyglutarate dehydrogenase